MSRARRSQARTPEPLTPERPSPAELAAMRADLEGRPPGIFPSVLTPKVTAGEVDAACFNLIDKDHRRLATLSTTDDGSPGLALFLPGQKRPRAELALHAHGPMLQLADAKGRQRVALLYRDKTDTATVTLFDQRGGPKLVLLIDRGRPHILAFPGGPENRHGVAFVPAGKLPALRPGAWARAQRAALDGRREMFETAALDSGLLTPQLDGVWDLIRRKRGRRGPRSSKGSTRDTPEG